MTIRELKELCALDDSIMEFTRVVPAWGQVDIRITDEA